ncbi:MAG: hypothetical protein K2X27_01525, partial [Candidatus Obscuribacterales bacterium]|nr:hypothetical protein [Candidatus Obscuribacterales bacterium]
HQEEAVVFKTRWSLSYLRGPLSRQELKQLKKIAGKSAVSAHANEKAAELPSSADEAKSTAAGGSETETKVSGKKRPILAPEISQRFASIGREFPPAAEFVYKPMIFASAQLRFSDTKSGLEFQKVQNLLCLIKSEANPLKWEKSFATKFGAESLQENPADGIEFSALPPEAAEAANYKIWLKDLNDYLLANEKLELFRCPLSGIYSKAQETEREFRIRLMQANREKRDSLLAELSKKYSDKLAALDEKLARAQTQLEREIADARNLQMESAIDVGASIFQAFVGRKVLSSGKIRSASSAARKVGKLSRQQADVDTAQESVEKLEQKIALMQAEFDAEMKQLQAKLDPTVQILDSIFVPLKKTNIKVTQFYLCWAPCVRQADGRITAAW